MRIIGGRARGTKIDTIESNSTRPTLDRVRESLFNIIQNEIQNAVVLDLFAGSGAFGLEAVSRGADRAYLCDINNKATDVIKNNIKKIRFEDRVVVYNCDYRRCLEKIKENINIVYIDPPYDDDIAVKALCELGKRVEYRNTLFIIETDKPEREEKEIAEQTQMKILDKRKYGRAYLLFLRKSN